MIVKNEVLTLEASIESIATLADEYIIVDTGSTDGTLELIKQLEEKYPIQRLEMPWNDNFGSMRNNSLRPAQGKWIFILDGDEYLLPQSIPILSEWIQKQPQSAIGLAINQIHELPDKSIMNRSIIRVFPNHFNLKFHGMVHEQVYLPSIQELYEIEVPEIQVFNREMGKGHIKTKYYAHLINLSLKSPEFQSPYLLYQQACRLADLAVSKKEKLHVLNIMEHAINLTLSNKPKDFQGYMWMGAPLAYAFVQMYYLLYDLKVFESIEKYYFIGKRHAQFIEFFYYAGLGFAKMGKPLMAQECFQECFSAQWRMLFPKQRILNWQILFNLACVTHKNPLIQWFTFYLAQTYPMPSKVNQKFTSIFKKKKNLPFDEFLDLLSKFIDNAYHNKSYTDVIELSGLYLCFKWPPLILEKLYLSCQKLDLIHWQKLIDQHPLFKIQKSLDKEYKSFEIQDIPTPWAFLAHNFSQSKSSHLECWVFGDTHLPNLIYIKPDTLYTEIETGVKDSLPMNVPEVFFIHKRIDESVADWFLLMTGIIPINILLRINKLSKYNGPRLVFYRWQSEEGHALLCPNITGMEWIEHQQRFQLKGVPFQEWPLMLDKD